MLFNRIVGLFALLAHRTLALPTVAMQRILRSVDQDSSMPKFIEYELGSRGQLLYFSVWLFFLSVFAGMLYLCYSLVLKWIAFLSQRKTRTSTRTHPYLLRIEVPTKFMQSPGDDITDMETVGSVSSPHSPVK